MAKQKRIQTAAAKRAAEEKRKTKVIRRRNEEGEVVEIEVENIPVEKATVKRYIETKDALLERRKKASDHMNSIVEKGTKQSEMKAAIGKAIAAIDKQLAMVK